MKWKWDHQIRIINHAPPVGCLANCSCYHSRFGSCLAGVASHARTTWPGRLNQPIITDALSQGDDHQDVDEVVENPVLTALLILVEVVPIATVLAEVPTRALLTMGDLTLSAVILEGEIVIL